jgi:hypothetical protein
MTILCVATHSPPTHTELLFSGFFFLFHVCCCVPVCADLEDTYVLQRTLLAVLSQLHTAAPCCLSLLTVLPREEDFLRHNVESEGGGRALSLAGGVVLVHQLLQVGELLVQILEVVPRLLVGGVPLVLLVFRHYLALDSLQRKEIGLRLDKKIKNSEQF